MKQPAHHYFKKNSFRGKTTTASKSLPKIDYSKNNSSKPYPKPHSNTISSFGGGTTIVEPVDPLSQIDVRLYVSTLIKDKPYINSKNDIILIPVDINHTVTSLLEELLFQLHSINIEKLNENQKILRKNVSDELIKRNSFVKPDTQLEAVDTL